MSVYLGEQGVVQLCRTGEPVGFCLEPADVNVTAKRISVEFGGPCPFITGDHVEVKRVDAGDLELIAGVTGEKDVTRWVHIDNAGGIRFYDSYALAVSGDKASALDLVLPSGIQDVTLDVVNLRGKCLAQMRSWEITTERETVDTTTLGEQYRFRYDEGLISGQGRITAIWDYKFTQCEDSGDIAKSELAHYFSELVIRFKEGSKFKGLFYIYYSDSESVWYDCDCIVTSVGMSFAPGSVIDSRIEFVTTGMVQLKQGALPSFLTQEIAPPNLLNLEEGPGAIEIESDLD
jgi:hypothetical protein